MIEVGCQLKRLRNGLLGALFAILLFTAIPAYGAPNYDREQTAKYAAVLLQSMAACPDYQELYQFPDVPLGSLILGNPISLVSKSDGGEGEDNVLYWPVLSGEEVVAVVISTVDEEGFTGFRLTTAIPPDVKSASMVSDVENGDPPVRTIDSLSQSEAPSSSTGHVSIPFDEKESYDIEARAALALGVSNEAGEPAALARTAEARSVAVKVSVPAFYQGKNPTCWATCASSIGYYLTGQSIDHLTISNRIHGYAAAGSANDAVRALSFFTYPGSATTINGEHAALVLPDAQIKNWINNGLPIYARLQTGANLGHAVVVCGFGTDRYGHQSATIMNPGYGRYEEMTKNGVGLLSINYGGSDYMWTRGTVRLTGWQKPFGGSRWSYMTSTGLRTTGWFKQGAYWYYFDTSSGYMLENTWTQINGIWYYLEPGGFAATGWKAINGYWYAFDESCAMRTGWFNDGGTWYYLRPSTNVPAAGPQGAMLSNGTWYIGGKYYSFNSSGACTNP